MTHLFKVGELAILQNPTYRHNPHNALCVVTQPYAPRPSFNTAVRPPVKLPPEWLYVVHVFSDGADYAAEQRQLKPLVKPAPDELENRQRSPEEGIKSLLELARAKEFI